MNKLENLKLGLLMFSQAALDMEKAYIAIAKNISDDGKTELKRLSNVLDELIFAFDPLRKRYVSLDVEDEELLNNLAKKVELDAIKRN